MIKKIIFDLDKFFTKVYGWDILPKKPLKTLTF